MLTYTWLYVFLIFSILTDFSCCTEMLYTINTYSVPQHNRHVDFGRILSKPLHCHFPSQMLGDFISSTSIPIALAGECGWMDSDKHSA